jgi:hypothetical protein
VRFPDNIKAVNALYTHGLVVIVSTSMARRRLCQDGRHVGPADASWHGVCKSFVSISGEFADWGAIKGLQIDAVAGVVSESDRIGVLEMYLAKFPSLQKLYQAPENEQGRQIVARLLESHFYRISPKWIRLIDNRKGFGHKEEAVF